ncbi:beta-ketoacyl synthase N-terminal-like domain-containing protein [Actinophytocola algeriensis]|uniref:Acyl transferase domain-containing protein/phosphopantetheinyl transferase n=1 Tax=Actinophytocola algeriensis TaxID=1768010 RepID=A0A7W7VGJ3_9PSEU|nr:beta-ketoacyl synthase N-terminal-like domain-containing protein [Actinophytocola algeriensis]MBB4909421.1 acyl transferase domain-containing protein/phosphopantetheinyl transferase [Actinophytocola algeriensis]MBE1475411.1 acyl transferase domain-containing protein/phosphopantetheinyl transferase [Actinophytocola algeriensis]
MTAVTPVAIVGMSVLFPGAPDLDTYWRNIVDGVDAIREVPGDRWDAEYYPDRVYCRRGGFVDAAVDVTRFGIMPNSVPGTEPDQLIALQVAAAAIADAGGALPADRQRAGIILGRGGYLTPGLVRLDQQVRTASQVVRTLRELVPDLTEAQLDRVRDAFDDHASPESAIGLVPNLAASRVANRLDLRGPAYTVDAACASSLVAVDHAVRELDSGRCDVVLAGGVHHCHDITLWSVFSRLGALSRSERIRPLHRDADGVLIGEGTGVVVLKRLSDAERDGDRVYAVIAGTGVASDGRTASLVNPDPGGQVRAVRQAWAAAGLDPAAPDSIGLLEAHGTATPAGDAAELRTIAEVFGPATGERAAIGSVKSMIGHTMPAAGVAGLVKAALALYHGVLPPTLHCEDPNPALAATRFSVLATARPWPAGAPRRAGVNAFGFGGVNAHVVLDAPARRPAVVTEPERVLRLAAPDRGTLAALLDESDTDVLAAGLDERTTVTDPVRLGVVDPTPRRLALARKAVAKGTPWRGRGDVWFSPAPLGGRIAFLFPGLEAEFEPNVDGLAAAFGLPWGVGGSGGVVGDVGRHGRAVFQLGRVLDTALRRLGIVPDAVAGHSVGEWTAMACGGLHRTEEVDAFLAGFDPDALRVPGVVFAALGVPADTVLAELGDRTDVVLSHDNAPNQSMVCGPQDAVEALVTTLRGRGVLGQVLPFRSGFHTPMLAPYVGPIRAAAERYTLHPPTTPVWSATTASPYPPEPWAVRDLFVRHLLEPVRFRQLAEAMHDAGFRVFVQLGAGQLGSLVGDTLAGRDHLVVAAHAAARDCLAQLRRVVTALWVDGAAPDLEPLPGARHARPTAPVGRSQGVRLDLGGALVSLPAHERGACTVPVRPEPVPAESALGVLGRAGARYPVAAELSALLLDTASVAAELITAVPAQRARQHAPERPSVLRVDVATMPYLLDHCFFRQRPGWPDDRDRWPIVPATTVLTHLADLATAPGTVAVALHDARMTKWIEAIPATDLPVHTRTAGPGRTEVTLGDRAGAVVETAAGYPEPPPPWRFDPSTERVPELRAEQLYDERWMFHGPRFQGVRELTAIGARHVRARLAALPAPGALLDNVGQVLGYWIMATLTERTTVFPVGLRRLRVFGPQPGPDATLECLVRITEVTDSTLTADMQLVHDGRVWADLTGWADRRFDTDPGIREVDRYPGTFTLSSVQSGGWALVRERWPDLATRELIMRNVLGGAERETYAALPPRRRRSWLLGRIAAKDAVRQVLWAEAEGEIFPAELVVDNEPSGRPVVRGVYGRDVGDLTVSIAHRGEFGVAIARRGPCGVDIEEVVTRPRSAVEAACAAEELAVLDELAGSSGTDLWFTRFWAAKEAVAKACGTGLRGDPRRFRVVAAATATLTVQYGQTSYRAGLAEVPGHVVAWTLEPEGDQ